MKITRILAVAWLLFASSVEAASFIVNTDLGTEGDEIELFLELACNVQYRGHSPLTRGQHIRISLNTTAICSASPSVASLRESHRPVDSDLSNLVSINYDGSNSTNRYLLLEFSRTMELRGDPVAIGNTVRVRVRPLQRTEVGPSNERRSTRLVQPDPEPTTLYVINISSSQQPHAPSQMPDIAMYPSLQLLESKIEIGGRVWHRLRLGYFDASSDAEAALVRIQQTYPTAWIDRVSEADTKQSSATTIVADRAADETLARNILATSGLDEVDEQMAEARRDMAAGRLSQSVQRYTKVLRISEHDRHAEAQELLGLARERNNQLAHAKAEYRRFLDLYPNDEAAPRVKQRLGALLARDRHAASQLAESSDSPARMQRRKASDWRLQTFFSQYYRRDVNQLDEQDEIVSQSALYSDANFDARRQGRRFDFASRISAGYRSDFLGEGSGSGNEARISYAYLDLADTQTELRGRLGRQSRNTGGVLGRFDGLNISYRLNDMIGLNAVAGLPVNSVSDKPESSRTFYGASVNVGPFLGNLELGGFYIQQEIEGIEDRRAIGTEFRYFGDTVSAWGLIDYDVSFDKVSSAFLQGSWRISPQSSLHASFDQRHTPYLSTGAALIGQPVDDFEALLVLLSEQEIRQLGLDRTPRSSSITLGLAHSLTPKLQVNFDANQSTTDATPASGGVAATDENAYRYYSASLIASSLVKEGDVSRIGLRFSDSDNAEVISLTIDTRIPVGRRWRVSPRLRVDQREFNAGLSEEILYTPGLRLQYRRSQKFRMDMELGRQFSQRQTETTDLDRDSYFVTLGYQVFF